MNQSPLKDYTPQLQNLMQGVGVSTFKALGRLAGVSEKQIARLRQGKVMQMQVNTLLKLAKTLQVSVNELLATFSDAGIDPIAPPNDLATLQQEYDRLLAQMEGQRQALIQEFQQSSLQVLESWLIYWPTAAHAVKQNPQFEAAKLLPLVRSIEQLMQQWGVEAIASIGEVLPYDPRQHQLIDGTAQAGDLVKVRYTGYRQGDRLLYRAQVSPNPGN